MLIQASPLGVFIYSCATGEIASQEWCSKMWILEEMSRPLVNKTPHCHLIIMQRQKKLAIYFVSENNLTCQMSCLFVILPNQGLARVSANQYIHYFTKNSQREMDVWEITKEKSVSACSYPSFSMHALSPLLHVFLSRHLLKEERKKPC